MDSEEIFMKNTLDENIETVEKTVKDRCCSKCKRPCKGHVGPWGKSCVMEPEADVTEEAVSHAIGGTSMAGTLGQLILQMSEMNINMQALLHEQQHVHKLLERKISSHEPDASLHSTSSDASLHNSSPSIVHSHFNQNNHVSLKNGVHVPEKLITAAQSGECVNLSDFLPLNDISHQAGDSYQFDSSGKLVICPSKKIKCITNIMQWLSAWNSYEYVLIMVNPSHYYELAIYRNFIQNCSKKFIWAAVYAYDCRFRARLSQSRSFKFGTIDTDFYTEIFDVTTVRKDSKVCYRCKSFDHLISDCPFPSTDSLEANEKTSTLKAQSVNTEICFNWNMGRCKILHCKRSHMCQACGGKEPTYKCPCSHRGEANSIQRSLENLSQQSSR